MKYQVTCKKIEIYCLEVEADSKEEAKLKADSMLEEDDDPDQYHYDSDVEFEVYKCT